MRDPLAILQSSHCHLAGTLAAKLLPEIFGPLPESVIEAIRQHDYGWIRSDLRQLEHPGRPLLPFPSIAPEESTAIWSDSIRLAESASPLAGVLVSRHFCMLAQDMGDPPHVAFRERENARRRTLEESFPNSSEELERWTGAIGFCDLLSLYLCSGATEPAELPPCHPADGSARSRARKIILRWRGDNLQAEPRIFPAGTKVSQYIMAPPAGLRRREDQAVMLEWSFA